MTAEKQKTILTVLANDIIEQIKNNGATAAEVDASIISGFAVNIRKNKVETIEYNKGKNLGITVYFGYRTGSATTSDFNQSAIKTMIDKACHIARFTSEDPFVGLADQQLMAYDHENLNLELYHPTNLKIEEAIDMAKEAESKGFTSDKHITNSEGASFDTFETFNVYANSHNFCGTKSATKHSFGCSFIAEQKNEMQRDSHYTIARDVLDLENANNVAIEAAKRTVNRLGARRITTRNCPVIFVAEIARSIIGNFLIAINGNNIYRKSSFLLDYLNKPVFAKNITIEEDPFIPKAWGSAFFDDEGVTISRNNLVVDGILKRYVLDSYSARKLKMGTTGNAGGVHNLIIKTSDLDLNGLLSKMGSGLFVTELLGSGVNIVTGDYSRGVFGYWVENGLIQYPVAGATIAGNLKDMLLNIVAISNDIDHRSNILTGSILLDKMTVAGS